MQRLHNLTPLPFIPPSYRSLSNPLIYTIYYYLKELEPNYIFSRGLNQNIIIPLFYNEHA
jgi:hypothetical protein